MRKLLMAAPLAAMMTFGGCATAPAPDDVVKFIQDGAVAACSFLPAAATVAAILASIPDYSTVVKSICDAVTAKSARLGGAPVTVNGVPVSGHFIRGGRHRRGASVNGVVVNGYFVR